MPDAYGDSINRYYDNHPINEEAILANLVADGKDLNAISAADLADYDQDHYGGLEAVETLAKLAAIGEDSRVLDVCCGMGGPARWLAHTIGCQVTGIDLTVSRVESARRLSKLAGLEARVDFRQGDASAMPFPDSHFDALISQESWLHIADKARLIKECIRLLRPRGILAFTDIVAHKPLSQEQQTRLVNEESIGEVASADLYTQLLTDSGSDILSCENLSDQWTSILVQRLEMYRSLRKTTVEKFGEAHFESWDRKYSFYVSLFQLGTLGGVRIAAQKPE